MKRANPACCQVKDCPQKYTASCQYFNRGNPGKFIENEVVWSEQCPSPADALSTDDLATISNTAKGRIQFKLTELLTGEHITSE
jgi:hypothetical protein